MMSGRLALLAGAGAVMIVAAALFSRPHPPRPQPPPPEVAPIDVQVETVLPQTLQRTQDVEAEVLPSTVTVVKASVAGTVRQIAVHTGQLVDAGAELAVIVLSASPQPSPTPTPASSAAPDEAFEDNVRNAKADVKRAQDDMVADRVELASAQAASRDAESDLQDEKKLLDSGAIAKEEYDDKVQDAATARTREQTAESRLSEDQTDLARKQTALRSAQSLSRQAAVPVSDRGPETLPEPVSAPTPGTLACLVKEGAAVKVDTPLFKVLDYQSVRLMAHAGGAKVGLPVQVLVTPPLSLRIDKVDNNRIECDSKQAVEADKPVKLRIEMVRKDHVLSVRKSAVGSYDGHTGVWLVRQRGPHQAVFFDPVQTGLEAGGRVEIVSGLDAGDGVVWNAQSPLHNGALVQVGGDKPHRRQSGEIPSRGEGRCANTP